MYRFCFTDKWQDAWFCSLKPIEKILFVYLCDNCNNAGFIDVIFNKWAADIGTDKKTIEGALKGVAKGLVFSKDNLTIYLKTFLKHQKNLPLNEKNMAHVGILRIFQNYAHKFEIQDVNDFIQRGLQGALCSPSGIGIGNNIGNNTDEVLNWKNNFEIYLRDCKNAFRKFTDNNEKIKIQQELNPNVNILLSIKKGFTNFWGTKTGWKHKQKCKIKDIDWERTIINSIELNKVYYTKEELQKINQ